MGSYFTRTRAWWYIAFYDEYVGRHINTSAGLSILLIIPLYLYGIQVNRLGEQNCNHLMYNWQFFDKRNRLCHNMIMEHFEVHKENLEDVLVELDKRGPKVFTELPPEVEDNQPITMDDFALIDEISGLNQFMDNFMRAQDLTEMQRSRIESRLVRYNGTRPKEIALNDMRMRLYGNGR
ncbi:UNKNOWN [Stylonychia lemnae]|uniref:Uncharacterized protein n=1 Tax=Stylonychia lemnae TaxID=5949 RepID=A0A078BAB4_STYLE|nr:UNKNOWN [Stylonychia lemnae]|eukprot:CDW91176.1 UNKNOWN [Stylonychia lemnae]